MPNATYSIGVIGPVQRRTHSAPPIFTDNHNLRVAMSTAIDRLPTPPPPDYPPPASSYTPAMALSSDVVEFHPGAACWGHPHAIWTSTSTDEYPSPSLLLDVSTRLYEPVLLDDPHIDDMLTTDVKSFMGCLDYTVSDAFAPRWRGAARMTTSSPRVMHRSPYQVLWPPTLVWLGGVPDELVEHSDNQHRFRFQ